MNVTKTILIIDDDISTLEILMLILKNAGYLVETATDHHYLEIFERKVYPDLIILDNNLGIKSGSDICAEIKASAETRHIPVILISAMDNLKDLAKDACADDYISKPFGIQQILEVIQRVI